MDYKSYESLIRRQVNTLARFSTPEEESWRKLKDLIICITDCIRIVTGQMKPPIVLDGAKKLRHIKKEIYFTSIKGPDALLSPTDNGFILRLQKDQHVFRHRFSVAHEIGHTFFYDIYKNPPVRLISTTSSSRLWNKEEGICSAFAGELLLPRELLKGELEHINNKDKLHFLSALAQKYQVSIEVLVWHLFRDMFELQNCVAIFKLSQKESDQHKIRRYYGEQLKKYTRIKENTVIKKVLEILKGDPPYDKLGDVSALYSDIVEIWSRESTSGLQVVTLLSFKR